VEGRKEWDLKSCDNIFKALKMNFTSENAVKFCRRVGEKGAGPRPMVVGFRREAQKEDLLESAKDLRNTHFSEVSIIPDLTQEQRKEEAEMVSEAERRNGDLSEEDRTKNLEWMVVGARGERRIVKGVKRAARGRPPTAAARGGTPTTAARGGTPTAAARGGLTPQLLPALPQQGAWDPRTRGRGGAAGARGRGGAKRRRGEQVPEGSEEEEEEEVMEDSRQAPPQPGRT
jgi:hypothetical protein